MKWAVAIFAIATLFYLATADTPSTESQECVPGTTWLEDCNTCICSANGRKGCSRMECHKDIAKRSVSHGECEPGQTWKEDCNNCVCTSTGLKACTLMACPPKD